MKKLGMLLPLLLAGCAAGNNYLAHKSSTVEMYHIFDFKTSAPTAAIARAATEGLERNTKSVSANLPLQLGLEVPDKPGRFTIADPKAARCEGAAWTARAVRTAIHSNNLTLHACLYRYREGYQLDTYAVFQKTEGGLVQIPRDIANRLLGTPEEWVNKTIWDMVRSVEGVAQAKASHVEGQPELGPAPGKATVASAP